MDKVAKNSGREHYIRASDLRIGWVFLRDAKAVVCVLPKPWRTGASGGATQLIDGGTLAQDGRRLWFCHQGDVLKTTVRGDGDEAADRVALQKALEELDKYTAMKVTPAEKKRRTQQHARGHARGVDADEDEDDEDDDDRSVFARRLFSASPATAAAEGKEPPQRSLSDQAALLRLLARGAPQEWTDALQFQPDPLFRKAIAAQFVTELRHVASHLRRGYIERRDRLSTPRGRIVTHAAATSYDNGDPSVVCDYNDFDQDTPLHRVVVTALRVAALVLRQDGETGGQPQADAARLQHLLASIEPYPLAIARTTAARLRLPRLLVPRWQRPLRLAVAVLNTLAPLGGDPNADPTPDLSIPAASLWEALIEKSLKLANVTLLREKEGCFEDDAHPYFGPLPCDHRRIEPPWAISGARRFRADLIVALPVSKDRQLGSWTQRYVILDAKYMYIKKSPGDAKLKPVPVAQLRQVFAYGMLWRPLPVPEVSETSVVADVGLVYLGHGAEPTELLPIVRGDNEIEVKRRPVPFHNRDRSADNQHPSVREPALYALAMPFPTAEPHCGSDAALEAFLRTCGEGLRERLERRPD